MRILPMAGLVVLLSTTFAVPAQASDVPELWSSGPFTAQLLHRHGFTPPRNHGT